MLSFIISVNDFYFVIGTDCAVCEVGTETKETVILIKAVL